MTTASQSGPTFLDTYTANVSAEAGVDPALIAAIIAFVMQIVSGCIPAPTPSSIVSGGNLRRIALYRAMLANGVRPLSSQGRHLADVMESEASKLAPDDASSFIAMCGGDCGG